MLERMRQMPMFPIVPLLPLALMAGNAVMSALILLRLRRLARAVGVTESGSARRSTPTKGPTRVRAALDDGTLDPR